MTLVSGQRLVTEKKFNLSLERAFVCEVLPTQQKQAKISRYFFLHEFF